MATIRYETSIIQGAAASNPHLREASLLPINSDLILDTVMQCWLHDYKTVLLRNIDMYLKKYILNEFPIKQNL